MTVTLQFSHLIHSKEVCCTLRNLLITGMPKDMANYGNDERGEDEDVVRYKCFNPAYIPSKLNQYNDD